MVGKLFRSGVLAGLALVGAGGGASAQRTERASVDSAGAQGSFDSVGVSLTADGRFVVFSSDATNLVANDRNLSSDVFVHDRLTGVTALVSIDANGNPADDASFFFSCDAISDDGRFVGFTSDASNLVPGTIDFGDRVYVKDLQTGAIDLVSVDSAGNEANLCADLNAISAYGRAVAFESAATNLVAGDTNGTLDVFVHDRQTGTTERTRVATGGAESDDDSERPCISADGVRVAFTGFADDLVAGDGNGWPDVFVHDRSTGVTERMSVDAAGGDADAPSFDCAITADGRFVGFASFADDLVSGDTNADEDVFERGPWLTLEVEPAIVLAGSPLMFKTWTGQPSGATLLVTTALNGSPLFGPLISGSFDAAGKWVFSATVPGGLAGNVVTFATFGIVPPGKVAISGPRNVSFQ